jgi:hypothetical protein
MGATLAEFKLPAMPDQKKLQKQMAPLLDQSLSLEVKDEDAFIASWALVERHDVAIRKISEIFDPFVTGLHKLHRMAVELRANFLAPVLASKERLLKNRQSYRQKQEELAKAERDRAAKALQEKQAKELTREAKKLERQGESEAASVLRDQAANVPMPAIAPAPAVPKQAGSVVKTVWKFEIVDAGQVPREYCEPVPGKIRKVVEALGDKANIPGVRVFPETKEHSRSTAV